MTSARFSDLRPETHQVIEDLLSHIYRSGEWDDEHEQILDEWRAARGEDAKDDWVWWVGQPGCETYAEEAETREKALEIGRANYVEDGCFEIVEARLWNDLVKDGEETMWFAESRNKEVISVAEGTADA